MSLERHDLLHLNFTGRKRMFAELVSLNHGHKQDWDAVKELLLPEECCREEADGEAVPGIVRREECLPRAGSVPVGFSSWRSGEQGRLRLAAFAEPEDIVSVVKPEAVAAKLYTLGTMAQRTSALAALAALQKEWSHHLTLGVWGSAALEIETGRAYTHQQSDLDLLFLPQGNMTRDILGACLAELVKKEQLFGIRIDAELRLGNGYGISLKELLAEGAAVLGKGRNNAILIQKAELFEGIANPVWLPEEESRLSPLTQ
jgi:malonate decarboxylase holo-[acyl-carrier-protein] synthase